MGKNVIKVHLGLDEMLKDNLKGEYQELQKTLGSDDKNVLVREVYDYMINPEKDDLNPEGYNPNQKEVARSVEDNYAAAQHTPNFMYETNTGGTAFMHFNEKLSKYPDAFHLQNQDNVEFGNLEEQVVEEHVHLKATPQDMGGKR